MKTELEQQGNTFILGDCIKGMSQLPDKSFDLAIADPAYGASVSTKMGIAADHNRPRFGGEWTQANHVWDQLNNVQEFESIVEWLKQLRRLVKPTGSIWIHSTYHNSGFVNVACQLLGMEIINEIVWFKRNAFPNLSKRRITASHETILWVHTGTSKNREYRFNYEEVKGKSYEADRMKEAGKQMRTVWDVPNNKRRSELEHGKHPTQKPLRLTERLLDIAGTPGGRLLIPFLGSGTEAIAAARHGMTSVGFETDPSYVELACRRMKAELSQPRLWAG